MDLPCSEKPSKAGMIAKRSFARRWSRRYLALPLCVRISVWIILLLALFGGVTRHVHDERDFTLKQYPSDFSSLIFAHPEALWRPQRPIRYRNGTHIDERYVFMRQLGKGNEGTAALYVDTTDGEVVVVKTFQSRLKNGKSILRNSLPDSLAEDFEGFGEKWPTDIEASLLIGSWTGVNGTAFVPVRDYFVLNDERSTWHWALVTPFIEDGTLEKLAENTKVHERTPQKLDIIFRPVLEVVLGNLGSLHASRFCHDDIKLDNIFVADTKHWLIGDLGCVRHFAHPWHLTGRIKRDNQWQDCQLNDIRRLLKTYMTFLRRASRDTEAFDRSFVGKEQAWSRFYWRWMEQPVSAAKTLVLSQDLDSNDEHEWQSEDSASTRDTVCLSRKVDMELEPMPLHWRLTDYWPLRRC